MKAQSTGQVHHVPALPPRVAERLEVVQEQVDKLVGGQTQDPRELKSNLRELCLETRDQRPLGVKTREERERARAVARVMGEAIRMATAASLAGTGSPLVCNSGVPLEELSKLLEADLAKAYSAPAANAIASAPPPPPDLIEWVEVSGGTFSFGRENQPVELPTYYISKYPITRSQYHAFLDATGYEPDIDFKTSQPDGALGDTPAAVPFWDARAFTHWVGGKLPDSEQWEKAFRPDGRQFPWGEEFDSRKLNHDGPGPISVFEDERHGNVSPLGVVGGSGNVAGWVDDATPNRPGAPLMLGGSYGNYAQPGGSPFDVSRRTSQIADSYYSGCGFWVVTDKPPANLGMQKPAPEKKEAAPEGELVGSAAEASERIREHAESLSRGHVQEIRPLKEQLRAICDTVRESRPLTGSDPDPKLQKTVAGIHATANHIAVMATALATGSPLVAAGLGSCKEWMLEELDHLDEQLKKAQALGIGQVSRVDFQPASGDPGLEFVDVPGGEFLYGRDNQPRHLPGFQLSKYPVTNQQYARFVEETGYRPEGGWRVPVEGADDEWSQSAANHVTYFDAKAYCAWAGGRLPSEPEWEKAARGTDGRRWPWGDEWRPGLCNNEAAGTQPVTRYEAKGNVSPYGAVGMVGDVLELTDTPSPDRPGAILTKGGGHHNFNVKPFDALRYTTEPLCASHGALGFRVARDMEGDTGFAPASQDQAPLTFDAMSRTLLSRVLSLTSLVREKCPTTTPEMAKYVARLEDLADQLDEDNSVEVKARMRHEIFRLRSALQEGPPENSPEVVRLALEKARNAALDNSWEMQSTGLPSQVWTVRPDISDLPNYGEASPQLLRGGQPDQQGVDWLKERGVQAVVDLRDARDREVQFDPPEWGQVKHYAITVEDMKAPDLEKVEEFLKLAQDPANQPLYVHCKAGMGRTGTMVACWRITQGWTADEAIEAEKSRSYNGNFAQEDFVRSFEEYWKQRA